MSDHDHNEGRDEDPYRMYAIMRGDLGMTPGKLGAQTGHAFLDAWEAAKVLRPETLEPYKQRHGIKIVLRAKSETAILRAYDEARSMGIPAALIIDLGYFGVPDHLKGKSTVTGLGLGPARRSEIDKVTKRFQVMP